MYLNKNNKTDSTSDSRTSVTQKIKKHFELHWKKYVVGLSVLVIIAGLSYWFFVKPALVLKADAYAMVDQARDVRKMFTKKDYEGIRSGIADLELTLEQVKKDYYYFDFLRSVPFARDYFGDGDHIFSIADEGFVMANNALDGLEPYKELLGFTQNEKEDLTAEEQILRIAQISPQLIPLMDQLEDHLQVIAGDLEKIDISKYPEEFRGIALHDQFARAKTYVAAGNEFLQNVEPILPFVPAALGEPTPSTYMILFQNDKEIRPTGGFITAYALVEFANGKFKIISSNDIYDLNAPTNVLPTPRPILDYLGVSTYNMRDSNFSPDYQQSIDDFKAFARYTSLPELAGIVALDTQFVERMIEVTGPIDLPQYSLDFSAFPTLPESCKNGGTVFTAENVVCRLELYAQKLLTKTEDRKQIVGDLMEELVDRILTMKAAELPTVVEAVVGELNQKHVLISFTDTEIQKFIEQYNWGGTIKDTQTDDYLHINDANLAGLKSDMYLKRYVDQQVRILEDGTVEKTVTLTYENPEPQDGWLNAVARNYVRVYVPQGSELVSFTGDITRTAGIYDDLGKTVFDNFILVPPLESKSVEIVYTLPTSITGDDYSVLIQKQAGKDEIPHTLSVNGVEQEFGLLTDKEITVHISQL